MLGYSSTCRYLQAALGDSDHGVEAVADLPDANQRRKTPHYPYSDLVATYGSDLRTAAARGEQPEFGNPSQGRENLGKQTCSEPAVSGDWSGDPSECQQNLQQLGARYLRCRYIAAGSPPDRSTHC